MNGVEYKNIEEFVSLSTNRIEESARTLVVLLIDADG